MNGGCPECGWPRDRADSPGMDAAHTLVVHVDQLADGYRAWTAGGDHGEATHADPYEAMLLAVRRFRDVNREDS